MRKPRLWVILVGDSIAALVAGALAMYLLITCSPSPTHDMPSERLCARVRVNLELGQRWLDRNQEPARAVLSVTAPMVESCHPEIRDRADRLRDAAEKGDLATTHAAVTSVLQAWP